MSSSFDVIIVIIFLIAIFLIGIIDRKKIRLSDYWVNNRKTNKYVLIATMASTFVGTAALISTAGISFSGGGLATLLLMGSFLFYFILFAKFFAPKIKEFGDKYNAYTIPDFLEHRYSKKIRVVGLIVNLITWGFFLALQILGIGIFINSIGNFNPIIATIIGAGIVIAYTSVGGLKADIRTDVFQFLIMLLIILVFLPLIILKSGGFAVITTLPESFLIGKDFAPMYVFILGFLILGATTISSADIWQRVYASDSKKNAIWAMKITGIIVFLFLVAGTLFGIYGKILIPNATQNTVVPELLKLYLPNILFGLIVAAFFAAIMSSADTTLLIMSMTIVHDLYQKTFNHKLPSKKILKISRWTTLIIGILALIIALVIFNVVHIAIDAVSFFVVLLPAIIFGFYWKKATATAALFSIILGAITLITFLFISPVEAFIPALFVSFISFLVINYFVNKRRKIIDDV